ncbi:MAG: hypothetical protein AB1781_02505 [Pseudomonadota bacterium]
MTFGMLCTLFIGPMIYVYLAEEKQPLAENSVEASPADRQA